MVPFILCADFFLEMDREEWNDVNPIIPFYTIFWSWLIQNQLVQEIH